MGQISKREAGGRGGKKPGAGRKTKKVIEKATSGNPGERKLTVLDIPEVEGNDMLKPDEILSAPQKDGITLQDIPRPESHPHLRLSNRNQLYESGDQTMGCHHADHQGEFLCGFYGSKP